MENHVSRGRDIGQNRNFRQSSGQNRQFREAGGLHTVAPRAAAYMPNSDRDRSFHEATMDHSAGKKILYLLLQYIAENTSFFLQVENHASRGSRESGGHQNPNFRHNSGQNRQRREAGGTQPSAPAAAAHVQNSGRGRSFRDPATPHSAAPRGIGGDGGSGHGGRESSGSGHGGRGSGGSGHGGRESGGSGHGGRGSGGSGHGGRGGAPYVARQPSSEPAATTAAIATVRASGRASRPTNNSCSMIFRGSSTTSVSPNQYGWSHHCSALFSWRMGRAVCGLKYVLFAVVGVILFLIFIAHINEIGNFPKVHADLKNRMIIG